MRSRTTSGYARLTALGAALLAMLLTAPSAAAAPAVLAQSTAVDKLNMPVGVTAVGLGIVGMVAGVFRKKKIQPENQRKN
ncbi:hypothetical protein [Saccharopolyspora cebuensis]|uniref:Uncharacterized protein n=1 Tax=Saccharopolyspora cebuensis TaxID=418759 RepID=A0ABV4CJU7_9PSEU